MITRSENDLVSEGGKVLPSDDGSDEMPSIRTSGPVADALAPSRRQACVPAAAIEAKDDGERHLMSAFSIHYDGRYYRYNGYRYDRLAQAIAYAEHMQSRQSTEVMGAHPYTADDCIRSPSASDRETMAPLAISFDRGVYAYREFRYDDLADAVNYARIDVARKL